MLQLDAHVVAVGLPAAVCLAACSSGEPQRTIRDDATTIQGAAPAKANGAGTTLAAAATSCPQQDIAFQCQMGSKTARLCVQPDGTARYTFGTAQAAELTYPAPGQTGAVTYAARGFAGGGEDQYAFTRDGHTYVLYESTVRGSMGARHNADLRSGIAIIKDGKTIRDMTCSDTDSALEPVTGISALPKGSFVER